MHDVMLVPDTIDFNRYLKETDAAEKVRSASDYLNGVLHVLAPAYDTPPIPKLPFANAWVYFAPGEVTLWAGFNGSGKSMLTGQVLAGFAQAGERICIASFEMKPEKTLARILRQVCGDAHPARTKVEDFLRRSADTIWLYDQQGTVQPDRIIAVVKHCAEKLGCRHVVIDSLMKCVKGDDDYNGQKNFVDAITAAARDYNVHVHLVAHLRKGENDERLPTRMDIKGSGSVTDLVDQVLILWRNKAKERKLQRGMEVKPDEPDAVLICDKNRNGDWEGRTKLWYDAASLRFSDVCEARKGIARELGRQ